MRASWPCAFPVVAVLAGSLAAQELRTERLVVRLANGVPDRLENRLTGEVLDLTADTDALALLWHQRPVGPASDAAVAVTAAAAHAEVRFTGDDQAVCTTRYAVLPDGDLGISQDGSAQRPGLYGVQWGISGVDGARATVIVPGNSGVAFRAGQAPFTSLAFAWPSGWEAGMVLLQMEKGGFLLYTPDAEMRFKHFQLRHERGRFALRFQSHNHAPFGESVQTDSVPWRIHAYAGDWRVGAGVYRAWMARQYSLVPLAGQQPAWVADIRFVVIIGTRAVGSLEPLARVAVPQRTLLYVPDWRQDPYDVNYPDYAAREEFATFMEAAHRLGFRVMPHVNYFGCDLKHPLYEQFKDVQLRSPHSDELQWWIPPLERGKEGEPRIKFAYIHPGSAAWRQLLVERFAELVERYKVDALHLDQTLCIPNHNRGRVDGMTVPEGNLQLHRDLRAALPQVALSGEGLDEVTLPFEAFAQRHAAQAVDHVHGTWNEAFIRCTHPISSYLFLPYNTIYGYLGMTNPANEGLYGAWKRAYEPWGVIPTFSHPQTGQLAEPRAAAARLVQEAGLWTRHRLVPDFDGDWSAPTTFRHRGADGVRLTVERGPEGGSRAMLTDGQGERELYRYITGVNRWEGPGTMADWPAQSASAILALDPEQVYLLSPGPRTLSVPRLSECPEGVLLTGSRQHEGLLALELSALGMERFADLHALAAEARTGIVIDGTEGPLDRGGAWTPGRYACDHAVRRAIHAHPPWQGVPGQPAPGIGDTFAEYTLQLPHGHGCTFDFAIGLRDGVNGRSDGVTFRVDVNGAPIFTRHWAESRWEDHTLDLGAWAGQGIVLRLSTSPGPAGNASFDWALWAEPRVRLTSGGAPKAFTVVLPEGPVHLVASHPEARLVQTVPAGGLQSCQVASPLPVALAFVNDTPVRVDYPVALPLMPFRHSAMTNGRSASLPLLHCSFAPGSGTAGGIQRDGFACHPPNNGRTCADFFLDLPAAKRVTLRFAAAIQDGAAASGCRFIVAANCRELASLHVADTGGWHAAEADLTPFAGGPVLLTLAVDSDGPYTYDWARWAEPTITAEAE